MKNYIIYWNNINEIIDIKLINMILTVKLKIFKQQNKELRDRDIN